MSLLISALEKAEQGKQQSLKKAEIEDFVFDLGPTDQAVSAGEDSPVRATQAEATKAGYAASNQQAAARLLAARAASIKLDSRLSPFAQGLLLLLFLLLVGGGVLWYTSSLTQPDVIVPRPVTLNQAASTSEADQLTEQEQDVHAESMEEARPKEPEVTSLPPIAPTEVPVRHTSPVRQSTPQVFGEVPKAPEDSRVHVSRGLAATTVNQFVITAYEAFNRGDDNSAQQAYRQALQGDVRNVDALLGMAAIAARQGRNQDATGWYQKVLDVEPRNSAAQAAIVDLQGLADPVSSESRLKNLISQQPEVAHLHAALGHLYGEQDQWSLAQQAYFQAHHLDAANPEYAFNLAISLDQMGKQALALQYYRRTQELLTISPSTGIDQEQLAVRIQQLQ